MKKSTWSIWALLWVAFISNSAKAGLPVCSSSDFINSFTRQCATCPSGAVTSSSNVESCQCERTSGGPEHVPYIRCRAGETCYPYPTHPGRVEASGLACVKCGCFKPNAVTAVTTETPTTGALVATLTVNATEEATEIVDISTAGATGSYTLYEEGVTCASKGSDWVQMVASVDQTRCIPCPSDAAPTYDATYGALECNCGGSSFAKTEKNPDGSWKVQKSCQACQVGYSPRADSWNQCFEDGSNGCPSGSLVSTQGLCFSSSEWSGSGMSSFSVANALKVIYNDVMSPSSPKWWHTEALGSRVGLRKSLDETVKVLTQNGEKEVESAMMNYLYQTCAIKCARGVENTGCECLSNLCVLSLYNKEATVCQLLESPSFYGNSLKYPASAEPGQHGGLPWIMYGSGKAAGVLEDTRLKSGNILKFAVAKYSLEGKFLGTEKLSNQIEMCQRFGGTSPREDPESQSWKQYANSVLQSCDIPLNTLVTTDVCKDPVMYDLFVIGDDGQYVPVPVRIMNTLRGGKRPNLNLQDTTATNDDFLVRRFFLCDAASGISGLVVDDYVSKKTPSYVRWASHMLMELRVQDDAAPALKVPVLTIMYLDAEVKDVNKDPQPVVTCTFRAEYSQSTDGWWTAVTIFLVVAILLLLVNIYFRYSAIDMRYPWDTGYAADPGIFPTKTLLVMQMVLKALFGTLFWFHFAMGMYWIFFFKLKDVPDLLLPDSVNGKQYDNHDSFMITTLVVDALALLIMLHSQGKVFIFLVDREQKTLESAASKKPTDSGMAGDFDKENAPDKGTSVWRALFIANELNERVSSTRTSGYVTWSLMVFFLKGLSWEDSTRWTPVMENTAAPFNPFLQYAVTAGVWLLVVIIQLLGRRLIAMRQGMELTNFIDICSLANVSVLIMDEPHHGFYIHGRCPGGKGDSSATEMHYTLHEEGHGLLPRRGLTPENPMRGDLQTFEVYFSQTFKEQIFNIYRQIMGERGEQVMMGVGGQMGAGGGFLNMGGNNMGGGMGVGGMGPGGMGPSGMGGNNNQGGPGGMGGQNNNIGGPAMGQNNMGGMNQNLPANNAFAGGGGMNNNNAFGGGGGPSPFGANNMQQNNAFGGVPQRNSQNNAFGGLPGGSNAFGGGSVNPFGGGFEGAHRSSAESPDVEASVYNDIPQEHSGNQLYGNTNHNSFGNRLKGADQLRNAFEEVPAVFEGQHQRSNPGSVLSGSNTPASSSRSFGSLDTDRYTSNESGSNSAQCSTPASTGAREIIILEGTPNEKSPRDSEKMPTDCDKTRSENEISPAVRERKKDRKTSCNGTPREEHGRSHSSSCSGKNQKVSPEEEESECEQTVTEIKIFEGEHSMNPFAQGGSFQDNMVAGAYGGNMGGQNNMGGGGNMGGGNPMGGRASFGGAQNNMGGNQNNLNSSPFGGGPNTYGNPSFGDGGRVGSQGMGSFRGGGGGVGSQGIGNFRGGGGGVGSQGMGGGQPMIRGPMGGPPLGQAPVARSTTMGGFGGSSVKKLAVLRYQLQEIILGEIDQVVRDQNMSIKGQTSFNPIWGVTPNVMIPNFPTTFFEDHSCVRWTAPLAYGAEHYGIPTGFEWQLITLEFLVFSIVLRFTDKFYLGIVLGFLIGQAILARRSSTGERRLSETALVDSRFLL